MMYFCSSIQNPYKLICFLAIFIYIPFAAQSQHVLYGERNINEDKIALYFDYQGTVYPQYQIADSSLLKCSGSLSEWYRCNPAKFSEICNLYNYLAPDSINPQNLGVLQDSIIASIWRKINVDTNKTVTFLIHGYRKSFRDIPKGMSSVHEFNLLRHQLDNQKLENNLYVEVYWDGTYNCCFSANRKKNDSLFRQFELAQEYAPNIGLSLRKIINGIQAEKVNIIAHSLGSKIAVSSLFNLTPSFVETPDNKTINLCLIAPAIAGIDVFEHYYDRKSAVNFNKEDNYRLYIFYNERDFVLKKKDNKIGLFGPGVLKYGNTSLGCNYKDETIKLEKYFRERFPASQISMESIHNIGKNHSLGYFAYGDNLRCMVDFMNQ